eukprot:8329717-Prorocentrum_lima.AAC.1
MADKRRDVGSTHEWPRRGTQQTPATLMHLSSARVVRVGDVDVLCVDLATLKNVVVLVCVDMTAARVSCMLTP